ncbi:tripartite tricarboxylate transporter substrate binding protein [Fictibacillus terranigra]|uniref:Tripartite tricarboxylate transporter substrate-binding protein n=1 Tax=Fictibacillus terranigra TaxID=3058424 RepID=A0ABT8ECB5_9BACL|nr:tripartite tricarboxylate transporter substrate-binding protein [Fictibacillus sp. CENA-BCM004]MDN4075484.1 tripartite tricarboxylate transporter substrate-binding protein [Fictibacillus sp. CENA-BCM004]
MKSVKKKWIMVLIICLTFVVVLAGCNSSSSAGKTGAKAAVYSKGKPVTIVAPAPPGSGWDLTARALVETFTKEKAVKFPIPVVNEPGATGAVSLSQLVTQSKGAVDKISVTSTPIMVNYLRGNSDYSYKDVTMIARLMTEYYTVVVPKDSPYKSLKDLLNDVKEKPQSIPVGASGDDQLPFALLVDEAGGDAKQLKFVSYEGGGEITNALLNGDLKVAVSGISEFSSQIEAGKFRALAVLSDKRLGGVMKDIPTAIEQGVNVSYGNWRGVMGPPDMPKAAVKYWQDVIETSLKSDTWKEIAKKNQWETTFMKGEELQKYLDETNHSIEKALQKTGQEK